MQNILSVSDIMKAVDELNKAISVTDLQTPVREDLSELMAVVAPSETPFRNRLERTKGEGTAHAFHRLLSNLDPVTGGRFLGTTPTDAFFANGGLPNYSNLNFKKVAVPYSALGDIAYVTWQNQASGRSYTDQRAMQIRFKMRNLALIEEWASINGDSDNSPAGGGTYFDGVLKQCDVNVIDMGGAVVTLNTINALCFKVKDKGGFPRGVLFGYRDAFKFNQLVLGSYYRLTQAGAGGMADITAGVSISRWQSPTGPLDVLASPYMLEGYGNKSNILVFDDKSQFEDGCAIQFVDLMPVSAVDLAMTTTAYKTVVFEFTALQVTAPGFQAKAINVGRDPNLLLGL